MQTSRWLLIILFVVSFPLVSLADQDKDNGKKKKKDDVEAIGDRDVDGNLNFFSIEKELALGKQLADEIERTSRVVSDPLVAEYINRVGQNLARNSDGKVPFTFKIVDSPQVNAFALPGGFLFVHSGLILQAETEGELAGVLAHEIAHVAARHGTRQATRGQLASFATIPLIFLGGWTGYGIQQAAGLAIPIGFLQFSRKFEAEADWLGLQYLYASGYDPSAFIDFFERLQAMEKRKPGTLASVFRSHPMTDDRIANAQKEIERILPSKPEYLVSTSEFLDVRERLSYLLSAAGKEEAEENRPRMRRTTRVDTSTIERPGTGTAGGSGGDEDDRPVLRRGGDSTADTVSDGEGDERPVIRREGTPPATGQVPVEEDDRPILRREGSGDGTGTATIERPPTTGGQTDDDRPVLKRKNQ